MICLGGVTRTLRSSRVVTLVLRDAELSAGFKSTAALVAVTLLKSNVPAGALEKTEQVKLKLALVCAGSDGICTTTVPVPPMCGAPKVKVGELSRTSCKNPACAGSTSFTTTFVASEG